MTITKPGIYILTEDFVTRGTISVGTIPKGTKLKINKVDKQNHKVVGPQLLDWTYWNMPVKKFVS